MKIYVHLHHSCISQKVLQGASALVTGAEFQFQGRLLSVVTDAKI